jgi:diguanylate cyclase (GGDEF)-like protein
VRKLPRIILAFGLSLASMLAAAEHCDFEPAMFEVWSVEEQNWRELGRGLTLPPRMQPGTSIVRFELPSVQRPCWLQIDRVSVFAVTVNVENQPPVRFDFFRPGPADRLSSSGFTVALEPHLQAREVRLEIDHLGSVSSRVSRVDDAQLLARERRIIALQALSAQVPLIMAVLMLLFWVRLRDRALAAYVGMLAALVLASSSLDGTLYFLSAGALLAGLKTMAHMVLLSLFGLTVVIFFREFLGPLDRSAERTTRILGGVFMLTGICSLVALPVFSAFVLHLTLLAIGVMVPLLFWQGVRSLRGGNRLAIYFLVGWSLPLIGIPLRLMAEYGLVEWGFWIRYAPRIALMFEVLVFALGLADRVLRFRIERDRAEQRRLHSEEEALTYRRQARTDALTGMASRRALDEELTTWARDNIHGSVLFIDIDHFKAFNDRHGHSVGDQALRDVAAILAGNIPDNAMLARYGGEEFIVLLPGMDRDHAGTLAENLRRSVRSGRNADQEVNLTISIGVAQRQGDESAQQTLARADAALYQAKSTGRDRIALDHSPEAPLPEAHPGSAD